MEKALSPSLRQIMVHLKKFHLEVMYLGINIDWGKIRHIVAHEQRQFSIIRVTLPSDGFEAHLRYIHGSLLRELSEYVMDDDGSETDSDFDPNNLLDEASIGEIDREEFRRQTEIRVEYPRQTLRQLNVPPPSCPLVTDNQQVNVPRVHQGVFNPGRSDQSQTSVPITQASQTYTQPPPTLSQPPPSYNQVMSEVRSLPPVVQQPQASPIMSHDDDVERITRSTNEFVMRNNARRNQLMENRRVPVDGTYLANPDVSPVVGRPNIFTSTEARPAAGGFRPVTASEEGDEENESVRLERRKAERYRNLFSLALSRANPVIAASTSNPDYNDLAAIETASEAIQDLIKKINDFYPSNENNSVDNIIYNDTNLNSVETLMERYSQLKKAKDDCQEVLRQTRTLGAEKSKNFLSSGTKGDRFRKLLAIHQIPEWLFYMRKELSMRQLNKYDSDICNEVIKALPNELQILYSKFDNIDLILENLRNSYCQSGNLFNNLFYVIRETWKTPVSIESVLNSCRIICDKIKVLKEFKVNDGETTMAEQIPLDVIWLLERVALNKELSIKYFERREQSRRTAGAYRNPLANDVTDNRLNQPSHNVSLFGLNMQTQSTGESNYERLVFFVQFMVEVLNTHTVMQVEQKGIDRDNFSHLASVLTESSWKKIYKEQIKYSEIQFLQTDYESRRIYEMDGVQSGRIHMISDNVERQQERRDHSQHSNEETILITTSGTGGGTGSRSKPAYLSKLPCPCGCKRLVKGGSILWCKSFMEKDCIGRKQFLQQNSYCLRCGDKLSSGHQNTCRGKKEITCFTCRDLGERDTNHLWATCGKYLEKQAAKLEGKNLKPRYNQVRVLNAEEVETVDVNDEEEQSINFYEELLELAGLEDQNEETINKLDTVEDEPTKDPFEEIVGSQYENSKFDIREQLKKYMLLVEKSRMIDEDKKELRNDISEVVKTLSELEENHPREKIDEALDRMERGLTEEEKRRIKNMLSSERRVKINRNHPNKKLYEKLVELGTQVNKLTKTLLCVMRIRLELNGEEKTKEFQEMITSGEIIEETKGGRKFIICGAMCDNGSTMSTVDKRLEPNIKYQPLGWKLHKIAGFNSTESHYLKEGNVPFIGDDLKPYSISMKFSKDLSSKTSKLEITKQLIIEELRLKEETAKQIMWPGEDQLPVLVLVGDDALQSQGSRIDPKNFSMERFWLSPDMEMRLIPFSVKGAKLVCCGTLGVSEKRMKTVSDNDEYPTFLLEPDWEWLDDIPEDRIIDFNKIRNTLKYSEEYGVSPEIYSACYKIYQRNPNPQEMHQYFIQDLMYKLEQEEEENNKEDLLEQGMDEMKNNFDHNISFPNIDRLGEEQRVMVSIADMGQIEKWILSEQLTTFAPDLCPEHKEISEKCVNCKKSNTPQELNNSIKYEKYLSSLTKVPVEGKPNVFEIHDTYDYFQGENHVYGQPKHSLVKESFESMKRVLNKARKCGLIKDLNNHLEKMIRLNAVSVMSIDEFKLIAEGKKLANFCLTGFVEKPDSKRTRLRPVADPSRTLPGLATNIVELMEAPKKAINSFLTASLIFGLNQHHMEADVMSAYYSVKSSPSAKAATLQFWFYQNDTEKPLIIVSECEQFGWGNSGCLFYQAVQKYPCQELEGIPRHLAANIMFVDNCPVTWSTSGGDPIANYCILNKLQESFRKYSIPLEDITKSQDKNDGNNLVKTYGLLWDTELDVASPSIHLSLYPVKRGRKSGPGIEDEEIKVECLTKRHPARFASSTWDGNGKYLDPLSFCLRYLLSEICAAMPVKNYDQKIITVAPDLAEKLANFMNGIRRKYVNIKPTQRFAISAGFSFRGFVLSHDGSMSGNSGVGYILSKRKKNNKIDKHDFECNIVCAKSQVKNAKVFNNEAYSFIKAMELLYNMVVAYKEFIPKDEEFHCYLLGDNCPSTSIFGNGILKDVIQRGVRTVCSDLAQRIQHLCPNLIINLCWVSGNHVSADYSSKFNNDPIALLESDFWRHGSNIYKNEKILNNFKFCTYHAGKKFSYDLPKNLKSDMSLQEAFCLGPIQEILLKFEGVVNDDSNTEENFNRNEDENIQTVFSTFCLSSPFKPKQVLFKNFSEETIRYLHMCEQEESEMKKLVQEITGNQENTNEEDEHQYESILATRSGKEYQVKENNKPSKVNLKEQIKEVRNKKMTTCNQIVHEVNEIIGIEGNASKSLILTPQVVISLEMKHFCLSESLYRQLIQSTFTMGDLIKKMTIVLKFVASCKKINSYSTKQAVNDALILIYVADQTLHPPIHKKLHIKQSQNGVYYLIRHLVENQRIFNNKDVCFLGKNSWLIPKIFWWCHQVKNILKPGLDGHHGMSATRNNILNGVFGCSFAKMNLIIRKMIHQCVSCLKSNLEYYAIPMSPVYTKTNHSLQYFTNVSFDPLGKISVAPWSGSKKKMQIYPAIFRCQDTGMVIMELCENLDKKGINSVLRRLYFLTGTQAATLSVDAQPQFTENTISPLCNNGEDRIWNTKIIQHCSRAQRRNYSENSTNLAKKIWERVFSFNRNEADNPIEKLTLMELYTLMHLVTYMVNSVPMSTQSGLSCNHLRYGLNWSVLDIPEYEVPDRTDKFQVYMSNMSKFDKIAREELQACLISNDRRFLKRMHSDGNKFTRNDLKPEIGDMILYKDPKTIENARMGRIISFKSDNTAVVQLSNKTIISQTASLHPLISMRVPINRYKIEFKAIFRKNLGPRLMSFIMNNKVHNMNYFVIIGWYNFHVYKCHSLLDRIKVLSEEFKNEDGSLFQCWSICTFLKRASEFIVLFVIIVLYEERKLKQITIVRILKIIPFPSIIALFKLHEYRKIFMLNRPNGEQIFGHITEITFSFALELRLRGQTFELTQRENFNLILRMLRMAGFFTLLGLAFGAGFDSSLKVNWWNNPSSVAAYDNNGYLTTKFGSEFVARIADEMVSRIKTNKLSMESNAVWIWAFVAVFGCIACVSVAYVITDIRLKRSKSKDKKNKEQQFQNLLAWQQRMERGGDNFLTYGRNSQSNVPNI